MVCYKLLAYDLQTMVNDKPNQTTQYQFACVRGAFMIYLHTDNRANGHKKPNTSQTSLPEIVET